MLPAGQLAETWAALLDHHHAPRAARSRLEAERAAAREEIEATQTLQPLSQPVEERLAHPVRRGTQAGELGHRQAPPAMAAGDDSDLSFLIRMH